MIVVCSGSGTVYMYVVDSGSGNGIVVMSPSDRSLPSHVVQWDRMDKWDWGYVMIHIGIPWTGTCKTGMNETKQNETKRNEVAQEILIIAC